MTRKNLYAGVIAALFLQGGVFAENWDGGEIASGDSVPGTLWINPDGNTPLGGIDFRMTGGEVGVNVVYSDAKSAKDTVIGGNVGYIISGGSILCTGLDSDPYSLVGTGTYGTSSDAVTTVNGDTLIRISGAGTVLNGNIIAHGHGSVVNGDTSIEISGGALLNASKAGNTANVYAGAYGAKLNGNVSISVREATVSGCIIGGGNDAGDPAYSAYVRDNVDITIGAGAVIGDKGGVSIFGGFRKGSTGASAEYGVIGGNVNVRVSAGAKLSGDICAAGGTVNGDVNVVFEGFDSENIFSHAVKAGDNPGGTSVVLGKKTISFVSYASETSAYSSAASGADFAGTVSGFDVISIRDGSNVSFSQASQTFSTLEISSDSRISGGTVSAESLVVLLSEDFAAGEGTFDVGDFIAQNNITMALSQGGLKDNFTLLGSDGSKLDVVWSDGDSVISFDNPAIPEPAFAAAFMGLAALAFLRRKRA